MNNVKAGLLILTLTGLLAGVAAGYIGRLRDEADKAQSSAAAYAEIARNQNATIKALRDNEDINNALLHVWAWERQQLQDEYDSKEERSREAEKTDLDYAQWRAAPLPSRLHPGGGLLGGETAAAPAPGGAAAVPALDAGNARP